MTPDQLLGGGASLTTEAAEGSSAATDISLREYLAALRECDRELNLERINHVREIAKVRREADQLAVKAAFAASKELLDKHNDLIHAMERKDETYATRLDVTRLANIQSKMLGGLIVLGGIGVTNLVRLWTG